MSDDKYVRNVFESYMSTGSLRQFINDIKVCGIKENDPRMKKMIADLSEKTQGQYDYETFARLISPHKNLLKLYYQRQFVIPDFESFSRIIEDIYWKCSSNKKGKNATYIPQLANVPDSWGVSVCTADGQQYSVGDTNVPFTIQSCSKPLSYAIAREHLDDIVHQYVGHEPSGRIFNEMVLDHNNKPHNPMINAGAIIIASLLCTSIETEMNMDEKFNMVKSWMEKAAGGEKFGFNESVFTSEKEVADRNFALSYFMRENKVFPEKADMLKSLDFYFQLCSIETTAEALSIVASTLSNGGVCPLTDEKVFSPETVRDVLSLMHSCGMYDYSGQFAFRVGLPAKSGVAGAIMLVIPNLVGICCFSPQLDTHGNSVRGIQFCEELLKVYAVHPYDNMRQTMLKKVSKS